MAQGLYHFRERLCSDQDWVVALVAMGILAGQVVAVEGCPLALYP